MTLQEEQAKRAAQLVETMNTRLEELGWALRASAEPMDGKWPRLALHPEHRTAGWQVWFERDGVAFALFPEPCNFSTARVIVEGIDMLLLPHLPSHDIEWRFAGEHVYGGTDKQIFVDGRYVGYACCTYDANDKWRVNLVYNGCSEPDEMIRFETFEAAKDHLEKYVRYGGWDLYLAELDKDID